MAEEIDTLLREQEVQRSILTSTPESTMPTSGIRIPEDTKSLLEDVDAVIGMSVTER